MSKQQTKLIEVKIGDLFKFTDKPNKTFIVEMFYEYAMWYRNIKGNKEHRISFDKAEKTDIEIVVTP